MTSKTCQKPLQTVAFGLGLALWFANWIGLAQDAVSLRSVEEISAEDAYSKYPALASDWRGRLWAAWTSTVDGRDIIMARSREGDSWTSARRLDRGGGVESGVALQRQGTLLWAVWHGRRSDRWSLFARSIDGNQGFSSESRLTADSVHALHPSTAVSEAGMWVAYEVALQGRFGVEAILLADGASKAVRVPGPGSSRRPNLASCPDGRVFLAWDSTRSGNYDIWLAQLESVDGKPRLTNIQAVTRHASIDDSPWLACAADGTLWVAFNGMRAHLNDELRTDRHSGDAFVRLLRDGQWLAPPGVVPAALPGQVSFGATNKTPRDAVDPYWHWKQTQNYPRVFHDGLGAWIIWRSDATGAHDFDLLARYHDGQSWSAEVNLTSFSPGRDEWPAALLSSNGNLHLAWEGQLLPTPQRLEHLPGGDVDLYNTKGNPNVVLTGQLSRPPSGKGGAEPVAAPAERSRAHEKNEPPLAGPPEINEFRAAGRWRVFFGDPHSHSILSDAKTGWPDQLLELSRNDLELDFAVVSDHAEMGILQPSEHAELQLTARVYNQPGRFVSLSGWEWTAGVNYGHRVAVFKDDGAAPLSADRPEGDTIEELYEHLRQHEAVLSPHHSGNATWGRWNPDAHHDEELEPNFEIASWHGRFEFYGNPWEGRRQVPGHQYQDALRRGLRVGVMAASDTHHLTPGEGGLTAVLAERLDRESLFEALRRRRNYATTGVRILLDFTVNAAAMGSVIQSDGPLEMTVRIVGTDAVDRVEIVRGLIDTFAAVRIEQAPLGDDGVFLIYEPRDPQGSRRLPLPDTRRLSFSVTDTQVPSGQTPYYVRVTQSDGHQAWSSPVWVTRK